MKNTMEHFHSRFIEGVSIATIGGATITLDAFKWGTVVFGFLGAILTALGGWEAWRAKRLERRMRELEIVRMQQDILDNP